MNTTVVTARGQVAIPVIIRQRLNIKKGTRLYIETRNDEIVLKAVKSEYFAGISAWFIRLINFRRISDSLAKVPSMGYALLYLALIPVFAFVYWALPYHFYHSTVQFEGVLSEDADEILRDIREAIVEEFERSHGNYYVDEGDWRLNITTISVHSLKPETDRTRFTIRLELWGLNELEGVQSIVPVDVYIENKMSFGSLSPGEEWVIFKKPEIPNKKTLPISPSLIFPYKLNKSSWPAGASNEMVWFPTSKPLHEKILAFSHTVKGFPAKASGAYVRMFYFSAVTITTLGYGDIVPITTTARILVAFESIAGIVLIGLFLNSLSREQANATRS